jgi:ABC-type polysaccharide transport system permease subunit
LSSLPVNAARRGTIERIGRFFFKYRYLHLLALPGVLYFVVFRYLPMYGIVIAPKQYTGTGGSGASSTARGSGS